MFNTSETLVIFIHNNELILTVKDRTFYIVTLTAEGNLNNTYMQTVEEPLD